MWLNLISFLGIIGIATFSYLEYGWSNYMYLYFFLAALNLPFIFYWFASVGL